MDRAGVRAMCLTGLSRLCLILCLSLVCVFAHVISRSDCRCLTSKLPFFHVQIAVDLYGKSVSSFGLRHACA